MQPKYLILPVAISLLLLSRYIVVTPAQSAVVVDEHIAPKSVDVAIESNEELIEAAKTNGQIAVVEKDNQVTQPTVTEQQCDDFIAGGDSADSWQLATKQNTEVLVTRLQRLGFTSAQIALMTKQSGIDYVIDENEVAFEASIRHWSLLDSSKKQPRLGAKESGLLQAFLADDDVDGLLDAFEQGKISTDKAIYRKPVLATILAEIDQVDEDAVSGLLDTGLTPGLYDLVVATERGLSTDAMDALFFASGIDATTIWRNGNHYSSLALVAVNHSQPALLSFWLSYGAPLDIDKNNLSAFDMISAPKTPQDVDAANQLFSLLLDNSDKPGINPGVGRHKSWLSKRNQLNYRQWLEYSTTEPYRDLYAEQLERLNRDQKTLAAGLAHALHLERSCL